MDRNIKLAVKIKKACEHLKTGPDVMSDDYYEDRSEYSCDAVRKTQGFYKNYKLNGEFKEFVKACGLDFYSMKAFKDFTDPEERQYARAIWLTMLYHIRKDYKTV